MLGASDLRETAGGGSGQGRLQRRLAFGKSREGQRSIWKVGRYSVGERQGTHRNEGGMQGGQGSSVGACG